MEVISLKAKPKLVITDRIMQSISFLHSYEKVEWSGLLFYSITKGSIDKPEELELRAEDLYLMDVGSHSYTEYEFGSEMMDVYEVMPQANPIYCDEKKIPLWKMGHIHTHHNMDAFFSGTDMQELKDNAGGYNYYLSLIVNYSREFVAKIAIESEMDSTRTFNYSDKNGKKKSFSHKQSEKALLTIDCEIVHENIDVVSKRYEELKKKPKPQGMFMGGIRTVGNGVDYPENWDLHSGSEFGLNQGGKNTKKTIQKAYKDNVIIEFIKSLLGLKSETIFATMKSMDSIDKGQLEAALGRVEDRLEATMSIGIESSRARFSDAPWMPQGQEIIVGGAGGIGSWVTLFLTRIGHQVWVYDDDTVDEVNFAGQFFMKRDLGKLKVEALKIACLSLSQFRERNLKIVREKYDENSLKSRYHIACFDNMAARKVMFENWVKIVSELSDAGKKNCIFIDGRMSAETGEVYVVTYDRIEQYKKTLFTDEEADELACSFKATSHNGAMIASQIVSAMNNHIANNQLGSDFRDVPFKIEYMLDSFYYKAE
jgi:proteasome lid subunit RPN8/RPN11